MVSAKRENRWRKIVKKAALFDIYGTNNNKDMYRNQESTCI